VLLAGALALVAALILGLAEVVEPWLAALIVGAILAAVGYVMVKGGMKRLEPSSLKLDRTADSLRKDKDTVTTSVGGRMQ
jgi:NhaP-type Na+/H+ or K+/H+ antiporter